MTASLADPPPGWSTDDDAIGPEYCPEPVHGVAAADVGDELVLCHGAAAHPLALDPVTAVLWRAFDGATPLRALAEDVATLPGQTAQQAETMLIKLARVLTHDGYLVNADKSTQAPRRLLYDMIPDLCLGVKLGVDRAEPFVIDAGDAPIRVSSTVQEIAAWSRQVLADLVLPDAVKAHETIALAHRGSGATRQVGRPLYRVYDRWGGLLGAFPDQREAAASFGWALSERMAIADGGTWFAMPALAIDGGALFVHPGLWHAFEPVLPLLRRKGIVRLPLLEAELDPEKLSLRTRPTRYHFPGGTRLEIAGSYPVVGVVLPRGQTRGERLRALISTAHCWDQLHLDAGVVLLDGVSVIEFAEGAAASSLVEAVANATRP